MTWQRQPTLLGLSEAELGADQEEVVEIVLGQVGNVSERELEKWFPVSIIEPDV